MKKNSGRNQNLRETRVRFKNDVETRFYTPEDKDPKYLEDYKKSKSKARKDIVLERINSNAIGTVFNEKGEIEEIGVYHVTTQEYLSKRGTHKKTISGASHELAEKLARALERDLARFDDSKGRIPPQGRN